LSLSIECIIIFWREATETEEETQRNGVADMAQYGYQRECDRASCCCVLRITTDFWRFGVETAPSPSYSPFYLHPDHSCRHLPRTRCSRLWHAPEHWPSRVPGTSVDPVSMPDLWFHNFVSPNGKGALWCRLPISCAWCSCVSGCLLVFVLDFHSSIVPCQSSRGTSIAGIEVVLVRRHCSLLPVLVREHWCRCAWAEAL
jgi:hypothetical protein